MPDTSNILVLKWKSMGDVVFTLPAVRLLRENFPDSRITFLTSSENEPVAAGFREVDELLVLDRRIFKQRNYLAMGASTLALVRRLRQRKFSLVVDLQCYGETALLSWLTRAPRRWAFQIGRRLRRFAYTGSLPRPDNLHPVDANLKLLTHFGLKPSPVNGHFRPPERGRNEARQILAASRLDPARPILFIQPFTSDAGKNWTLPNHLAVAEHWRAQGHQVVFGGGPNDREALQPVKEDGFPVLAGTDLSTMVWVLDACAVVVGGDTGVLHLANALGRRVVMIMGPPRPGSCIPYGRPKWVVHPRERGPLTNLTVDSVNRAIATALPARAKPVALTRG